MDDSELANSVDASFVDAFRRLGSREGGLVARYGDVEVAATGLPSAFFNPIFVLRALHRSDDLAEAVVAVRALDVPFVAHIRGDVGGSAMSAADELGLHHTGVLPGMAMRRPPDVPPAPSGLRIDRVTDEASYAAWVRVCASAFEAPAAFLSTMFPASLFEDPSIRGYVGYVDDEAVATAAGLQIPGVLGIYNVATAPASRRAGHGTAMTWRAIADADPDTQALVLQASEMGAPIYERMGFRTVVEYHEFQPRP